MRYLLTFVFITLMVPSIRAADLAKFVSDIEAFEKESMRIKDSETLSENDKEEEIQILFSLSHQIAKNYFELAEESPEEFEVVNQKMRSLIESNKQSPHLVILGSVFSIEAQELLEYERKKAKWVKLGGLGAGLALGALGGYYFYRVAQIPKTHPIHPFMYYSLSVSSVVALPIAGFVTGLGASWVLEADESIQTAEDFLKEYSQEDSEDQLTESIFLPDPLSSDEVTR